MKRLKIFFMTVLSVLLMIILASNSTAGNTTFSSDKDGKIEVSGATELYGTNNMYCVEHGQKLNNDDAHNIYEVKASIHIRGRELTVRRWNYGYCDDKNCCGSNGGWKNGVFHRERTFNGYTNADTEFINVPDDPDTKKDESGKTTVGELTKKSNQMAAIFYTSGLKGGETSAGFNATGAQITLWKMWNSWVDLLPEDGPGEGTPWDWGGDGTFRRYSGNGTALKKDDLTAVANANWEKVKEAAKSKDYSIDLYYLDNNAEDTWQALVIAEKPETIDISVEKVWEDGNNRDGKRVDFVYAYLYKNGKKTDTYRKLDANNNWSSTFTGLDKYDSKGNNIEYSVGEDTEGSKWKALKNAGYENPVVSGNMKNGFKITNRYTPEKVTISAKKNWSDDNNRDNYRCNAITATLYANGTKVTKDAGGNSITNPITLNSSNNWQATFSTNLYRYENGKIIDYTVKEVSASGGDISKYSVDIIETEANKTIIFNINNTHTPEKTSVPVTKEWDDDNNRDGIRPSSIKVTLYKTVNGTKSAVSTAEIKPDANGNWPTYTFTNLYKYENGKHITYTVEEAAIDGYTTQITGSQSGYTITNTHTPEKVKVKVLKQWNDMTDLDEYRPESITFKLKANGNPAKDANGKDVSTVVLTQANASASDPNIWETEITNLFRKESGQDISYTIEEPTVPANYTVGKMDLQSSTDANGTKIYTLTMPNTHEPHYDGYIEIQGKVWVDREDGKANAINGVMEDDEAGLAGIKVTLKDADGKQFDQTSTATTDANGNYTIKVNYDNSKNVYKLYEEVNAVKTKLNTAYVEFEYDGMTYTTVKTAESGINTSKAIENETERTNIDKVHQTTTYNTQHPDNWTDKNITAITKNVITSFDSYMNYTNTDNVKENYYLNTDNKEVLKYCNGNGTYIRTNPEGAWNDIIEENLTTNHLDHTGSCSGSGHVMREHDIQVEVIKNVNLGLFKREQPDVGIFTDLSKVEVEMQGQKYTYLYNVRSTEKNNVGLKVKFETKDTYTYKRPVNPADIAYIQEETNKNAMTVKVTYQVKVANLSTTLPITVHNITNYYDPRYELIIEGWTVTPGTDFYKATNASDLDIRLEPQTESSPIELTYNISLEAIRDLLNEDATLNNAVEIDSYSTEYGANTLYAEQRTSGRTGQPYAGYDYDSHPGNVTPENRIFINGEGRIEITDIEDDEDIAPSFVLCKDDKMKTLSGNVWEDTDVDETDDFRLGDGKKSENEKNLANAKIELYKVKDDGTLELAKLRGISSDGEIKTRDAVTYSDENGTYKFGDEEISVVTDRYVMKFTYGEGFEEGKNTTIDGVNVNARNYKSTIISADNINVYNVFKGTSTSEEWHLNTSPGYSIAVDDMDKRIAISESETEEVTDDLDLRYGNFGKAIYMEAYSKPFKMQVEYDASENKTSQVQSDGKTGFGNDLNIFDIGIVERAREDIYTEKTINNFKITLANGQTLISGNPNESSLDYVSARGFGKEINNGTDARNAFDKQLKVEMDAELIQGAKMDIEYAITVTNNSEKEYDYYVDSNNDGVLDTIKTEYYYFGTNEVDKSPVINTAVNLLVDYIDKDIIYEWVTPENWTETTPEDLFNKALISETTRNSLSGYKAYISKVYSVLEPRNGEASSHTEIVNATRTLANTDENQYENHMEILKIDGKVARTISGRNKTTGAPVLKTYKMGNYVPSLEGRKINTDINIELPGYHEQDDDRVTITITPPTGLTEYLITYIIPVLAGLIVLLVGVVIIKKKVLNK